MTDAEKKVKLAYEEIVDTGAYLHECFGYENAPTLKGIDYCLNILEFYFPELRSKKDEDN